VPIGGLAPLTTYHFRAVATNADGTTTGPDGIFTTGFSPPTSAGGGDAGGGPTTVQVDPVVTEALADVIAALRRLGAAKLGRTGSFTYVAEAPTGGTWAVTIVAPSGTLSAARSVTVAKARTSFTAVGKKRVRIKLTTKGRRLMKRTRKRIKLKVTTTFTPTGGRAVKRTKTFNLKRR
jgi:hypothetical protein